MSLPKVLYFGLVWPKLSFSAACVRTMGIAQSLFSQNFEIHYICPQKLPPKNDETFELPMYSNVKLHQIKHIEDYESILSTIQDIQHVQLAIFDTFIAEEKFSHFVHRTNPQCLKILDLQDLHSFRQQRTDIVNSQLNEQNELENQALVTSEIMGHKNTLHEESYGRELASIMRSDMVITCSDYEKYYLQKRYNLKNIELQTFFYSVMELDKANMKKKFDDRRNFVWIGNHYHPPNMDSLRILTQQIWPKISEQLPDAQLHIYGSKFAKEIADQNIKGVRPMGLMKSLTRLQNYKALLAPLRYGGGIKGKVTDSWANYLPVVTTPIGSEGLYYESSFDSQYYTEIDSSKTYLKEQQGQPTQQNDENQKLVQDLYNSYQQVENIEDTQQLYKNVKFGGLCDSLNTSQFVENAVQIYKDEEIWDKSVETGIQTLQKRMSFTRNDFIFKINLSNYLLDLQQRRQNNPMYSVTWSETLKSTENFAKYINQKRKNRTFKKKSLFK